jgi:hypothetical protein
VILKAGQLPTDQTSLTPILTSCQRDSLFITLLALSHPPTHSRRRKSLPGSFSRISSRSLTPPSSTRAGYTTSPRRETARGTYPRDAECAYIDEPATLFALADVRRSGQPVLVHCDGTGEGVDFVTALLVMSDRMSVDEAIERVTRKFPYISMRPTSRRQLYGFEEMLKEEEKRKARLYDHMASTSQELHQNMRGLLHRYLRTP